MNVNDFSLLNVFTGNNARGNQNAVVLLDDITNDQQLKELAEDFNLPATTFLKRNEDDSFNVRWLAPSAEIFLCGHGTVGATHALTETLGLDEIHFRFAGGSIFGSRKGDRIEANFARIPLTETETPSHVIEGFKATPTAYYTSSNKQVVVFENEETIRTMKPNWEALRSSNIFGYVITAPGKEYDSVSRVILPHIPILEDQATGSAHVLLTEYWTKRLGKAEINAYQASARGGAMRCRIDDERVTLNACCKVFGTGKLC